MRRFSVGDEFDFNGQRFRVGRGDKASDDLVLAAYTQTGLRLVKQRAVLMQVDFMAENEYALGAYRSFWQMNGDSYFVQSLADTVRIGWEAAADKARLPK